MYSSRIKSALSEVCFGSVNSQNKAYVQIHRRRADTSESWRWAMTVGAWTVDMEIHQYQP